MKHYGKHSQQQQRNERSAHNSIPDDDRDGRRYLDGLDIKKKGFASAAALNDR